jgi:hypothetical protein
MRERLCGGLSWILNMASCGVHIWTNIRSDWGVGVSSNTWFEVGESSKIKFWHDMWCGYDALRVFFQIYSTFVVKMLPWHHFEFSSDSYQSGAWLGGGFRTFYLRSCAVCISEAFHPKMTIFSKLYQTIWIATSNVRVLEPWRIDSTH